MSRLGRSQPFQPVLGWAFLVEAPGSSTPIGTGWGSGTWADGVWGDGTWADASGAGLPATGSAFLSVLRDTTSGTESVFLSARRGDTAGQSVFVDARRDS